MGLLCCGAGAWYDSGKSESSTGQYSIVQMVQQYMYVGIYVWDLEAGEERKFSFQTPAKPWQAVRYLWKR